MSYFNNLNHSVTDNHQQYFIALNGTSCSSTEAIGSEITCRRATRELDFSYDAYKGISNNSDVPTGCYLSEGQNTYFNIYSNPAHTLMYERHVRGICRKNGM